MFDKLKSKILLPFCLKKQSLNHQSMPKVVANYCQSTNQLIDESFFWCSSAHTETKILLLPFSISSDSQCCYSTRWLCEKKKNSLIYGDEMLQGQVSKMTMSARLNLWVVGAPCFCQKAQIIMISLIRMFPASLLCTSDFFISWSMW